MANGRAAANKSFNYIFSREKSLNRWLNDSIASIPKHSYCVSLSLLRSLSLSLPFSVNHLLVFNFRISFVPKPNGNRSPIIAWRIPHEMWMDVDVDRPHSFTYIAVFLFINKLYVVGIVRCMHVHVDEPGDIDIDADRRKDEWKL